ncbi:cell adhesion molecule CEACAM1 isoform X5 [Bos indicus]|uniref:Cell adhesion molecule CEACAM1 isoform X5 n=1 Tax=Bos indicus TaxID=9915 RepID=A0ABM4QV70_BOSIN
MGTPSGPSRRRCIPWNRLLLAAMLPRPVITSNNSNPWEHQDTVVLTCGPETQNTSYMWWINNQSLPNSTRLELSEDKRTLTVFNVTRNDTGPYVCEAWNPVSVSRSDPFTLNVLYPVAQPSLQASNTTVIEHEGPVVLTCLTDETGISIRWFFKGRSLLLAQRMTLSSDNSTLTIDPVSRQDAGDYQCEVSNRGNSSRSDPLSLHVKNKLTPESSSDLSAGAIVGIVIGAMAGVALIGALVYFVYVISTRGASDQRDLTEHKSSDHNHSQGHSDSSPEKVDEVEYSSLNFNAQELKNKATSASPSPTNTETIYSEVKKQ